jgi:hypothetical protein
MATNDRPWSIRTKPKDGSADWTTTVYDDFESFLAEARALRPQADNLFIHLSPPASAADNQHRQISDIGFKQT